ncbi:family 4 glycosyl hydrolase [Anaerorhabdus sp.]|uniref:family 4 glycosyl hydrolase n=1 Tax=Anaerorhabdus sp. TaxID=1872524 RepID=UPI002FC98EC3
MNKKLKVTVVGGGSTWTPGILNAFVRHQERFPISELVLFDNNWERQEVIGKYAEILFKENCPDVKVTYTMDKDVAYKDADFIMVQIRTGGYELREKDEKIPLKYGVVGQETCGPGGFSYGIRSLRDMIEIVEDTRERNSEAWILNYTNPAAIVAYGLTKKFPNDKKILNICDQPINLINSFSKLMNIDPNSIEPRYFGLNHFGWFTHLYDNDGKDVLKELKDLIKSNGFLPADAAERDQSWLDTYALVRDMVLDFDEFVPSTYLQYYFYPEYKASKLNPNYTRANEVMDGREKMIFEECSKAAQQNSTEGIHVVKNEAHGDMIISIAEAIYLNENKYFIVMVENNGIIENLPDDAQVEVTCLLGNRGPIPFNYGKIDTFYKGLLENQYAYEKLTCEAYFEGSYTKALQALTLNRTVNDAKKARKILDDLIEANGSFWPKLK